ncbi:TetR/AcrR family transcriptional regulator [Paenibacillus sp. IHBB 3054]|uniref:TetR/AcrR family transcriptional regulator n=1 Tax=Paenibacillus sp. IHBB 3054 TaxID=3425689 RepID=UPI003F670782
MNEPNNFADASNRKLTTYQEARLQNTASLRQLVVDAAAFILQEEGPEAVTVRKVAQKMGCSTKIIYSLFANKEGLAQQLYLEGCKILSNEFESASQSEDLQQYLINLAEVYWEFGQRYTSYYKLMFGGAFADFKPDEQSMKGTVTAMRRLLSVIVSAQEQGLIAGDSNAEFIVGTIWSSLHGVIHLHIGGHLGSVAASHAVYKGTVALLASSLFAPTAAAKHLKQE